MWLGIERHGLCSETWRERPEEVIDLEESASNDINCWIREAELASQVPAHYWIMP